MALSRVSVLVAASGAGWESDAVRRLAAAGPGTVLLKRCVDLGDLLASATTGQAEVALVGYDLPGLDTDSVDRLHRCGLAVVLVAEPDQLAGEGEQRLRRLGITHLLRTDAMAELRRAVTDAADDAAPGPRNAGLPELTTPPAGPHEERERGRLLAVWGPTGAPGRTTVAVGLAAELAARGDDAFLLDVDGFGGAVAQHLGVLDEMSGLLAAARLANTGQLDRERLATLARTVEPSLRVLTGLPRADRWGEVREGAFDRLLDLACDLSGYAVLDTSFSLEEDAQASFGSGAPQRHGMTLASLERADEVVVVGSADPVGLARLARGLVELLEAVPGRALRVVVNRSRPSLGWGEKEVRAMIEGFVTPLSLHFLPEDQATADRALVAGKSLPELGDSPLRRAMSGLADAVTGRDAGPRPRRRAFRHGQAPKSR